MGRFFTSLFDNKGKYILRQFSKKTPTFPSIKKNISKLNPRNQKDILRLEKMEKFVYDRRINAQRTQVKLSLMPVDVINGQLGVFAEEHMKVSDRSIGCYAGKRVKVGKENVDSVYIFEVTDDDGKEIECIDGEKLRDWTNFVNHSDTPNLDAIPRKIRGKYNIYFYIVKPIKKGEQLLFDYGKSYFNNIKPVYIHPTDNWQSPVERYLEARQYYLPGTYVFDDQLVKDLKLKHREWLVPEIFLAIIKDDVTTLKQKLKSSHVVDLLAFAVTKQHKMCASRQQQHLTALMFAAYLGREECLNVLMHYQADVNRCMLMTGFLPLTLLCKGRANNEIVERMGKKMLKKMYWPFVIDVDKQGLLHYAINRNSSILVKSLLARIEREDMEILPTMLKQEDLVNCITRGQFVILKMLFQAMHESSLKKPRFSSKLLKTLSKKNLLLLQALLKIFK